MRRVDKRDRQQVRTAAELENKYSFGEMVNQQASEKDSLQIKALRQEMARYMAATNAAIAELSAQSIISTASGENVVLSDSANHPLTSLLVHGPCTVGKIWTTNSDESEKIEAVLSASVVLAEGDILKVGQVVRSDGSVEELPEADKEALAALRTFKTTTYIYTDVAAVLDVEYVADTKAYVDNLLKGGD